MIVFKIICVFQSPTTPSALFAGVNKLNDYKLSLPHFYRYGLKLLK